MDKVIDVSTRTSIFLEMKCEICGVTGVKHSHLLTLKQRQPKLHCMGCGTKSDIDMKSYGSYLFKAVGAVGNHQSEIIWGLFSNLVWEQYFDDEQRKVFSQVFLQSNRSLDNWLEDFILWWVNNDRASRKNFGKAIQTEQNTGTSPAGASGRVSPAPRCR